MRLRLSLLVLLIFIFTFQTYFGQESSEAILFDELSYIYCTERDTRRMDNFLFAIHKNPDLVGYIIAYADSELPGRFSKFYKNLQYHVSYRKFPTEKISFIRGGNQDRNLFQFWLVPKDAAPPTPKTEYQKQRITFPTIFDKNWFGIYDDKLIVFGGDLEFCESLSDFSGFADFLRNDSDLVGYLVIYSDQDESKKFADKALKLTINKMVSEYKIPRQRLKTIYGGMRNERELQLWLAPKNEKFPLESLPKID